MPQATPTPEPEAPRRPATPPSAPRSFPPPAIASSSSSTHSTRVEKDEDEEVRGEVLSEVALPGEEARLEEGATQEGKPALDIEHLEVENDPRDWSSGRKTAILLIIAFSAMGGTVSANIFFPALDSLQRDLNTSNQLVAASVSLFILGQGLFPMAWSGISEIKGRKVCYIVSLVIYCVATAVCSRSQSIGVFIAMRVLQSAGSSAVLALGAGTLADIYDTHERGRKLGLYYALPLLGPSLGPLIGGALTSVSSWRSTFYFLLGYGVICLGTMLWLPETFRKERSHAYRLAMQRARLHAREDLLKARNLLPDAEKTPRKAQTAFAQVEKSEGPRPAFPAMARILTGLSMRSGEDKVKISLWDVNPLAAVGLVLRQRHNFAAVTYSGFLFASQYSVNFTASRSFAAAPYNYGPLQVGLVLLAFGVGNIIGSLGGGRYSDHVFLRLKAKNGGVGEPEMRIRSTYGAMLVMPPFFIVYAWVVQKETPVYWPIIALFVLGTATIWIYSSTLAYLVDSNVGRSSSAVACNSLFRGVLAAIASQSAEPLIEKIGNGWYYTGFAFLLLAGESSLLIVSRRGKEWREAYRLKEEEEHERQKHAKVEVVETKQRRFPWRRTRG